LPCPLLYPMLFPPNNVRYSLEMSFVGGAAGGAETTIQISFMARISNPRLYCFLPSILSTIGHRGPEPCRYTISLRIHFLGLVVLSRVSPIHRVFTCIICVACFIGWNVTVPTQGGGGNHNGDNCSILGKSHVQI